MPAKPSIVFAHGLWADGSCFSKVIPTLQAEGHQVIASQHALDSVESDVATVIHTIGRVSGPVLLVGDLDVVEDVGDGKLGLVALGGFCFVGGERGDIDQSGDPVIGARGGDQSAAVGVADKQDRAADPADRADHRRDVTFD